MLPPTVIVLPFGFRGTAHVYWVGVFTSSLRRVTVVDLIVSQFKSGCTIGLKALCVGTFLLAFLSQIESVYGDSDDENVKGYVAEIRNRVTSKIDFRCRCMDVRPEQKQVILQKAEEWMFDVTEQKFATGYRGGYVEDTPAHLEKFDEKLISEVVGPNANLRFEGDQRRKASLRAELQRPFPNSMGLYTKQKVTRPNLSQSNNSFLRADKWLRLHLSALTKNHN